MNTDVHDKDDSVLIKITRLFTYNRPLSILVVLGIVVAGILFYGITPKQYNPEITRPAFSVSVQYPNATANEVDTLITKELVEKIRDIENVDEVFAVSFDGGAVQATVIFDVGTDETKARVALYTRLLGAAHTRPATVSEPTITPITTDDVPIITIGFFSNTLPISEVRDKVLALETEIKKLDNVANLHVYGGTQRALTVHLDIAKMHARGITANDVMLALSSSNISVLSNGVRDGMHVTHIETTGTLQSVDNARQLVVAPGVTLSDVADVKEGYRETHSFVRYSDARQSRGAVYLSVAKRKGSNAPLVSEDIRNAVQNLLQEPRFAELSYTVLRDDGRVAREEIEGLGGNLITSIIIVGLVLYLFIGFRPAGIVMAAIPLTLLLVFILGYLFGQTINRITLFALILSLGLLVDSATVVVENIYRSLIEKHYEKRAAIVHAVRQVSVGLILSTVTSVVVFLPTHYITGMMGPYMGPIAFFVPAALIMSLLVAVMVTPFLASEFLDKTHTSASPLSKHFSTLSQWYARKLSRILTDKKRQKRTVLLATLALIAAFMLPLAGIVHFKMLPTADKEQFYVYLDMPDGTDADTTNVVARNIERILLEDKEIVSIQSFVGEAPIIDFNGLFKGAHLRNAPHMATLRVNLTHPDTRDMSSSDIAFRSRARLKQQMGLLPNDALVRIVEDPPGPPVRATFVAKITGGTAEGRNQTASYIQHVLTRINGVVDIDTSIPTPHPRIRIRVDNEKAQTYGVNTYNIANTIQALYGPLRVGQYHGLSAHEYVPIELSLHPQERSRTNGIESVEVRAQNGTLVPLASVANVTYVTEPSPIYSEEQESIVYVTAETERRPIVYVMIDVLKTLYTDTSIEIADASLFGLTVSEKGKGAQYHIRWGGEWKMTLENFRDLGIAMLVAFAMVYAILVAQYRSFLTPALIMATVWFGLLGILPGFTLLDVVFGIHLTATALIGFIALIGIVVNNAILLLEYFTEHKEMGKNTVDAMVEAGRVRLRPIMLTSLTTVLGSITIAGDPVWSGLAWSIIFGLSLSTVLTLWIFPVLYILFTKDTA